MRVDWLYNDSIIVYDFPWETKEKEIVFGFDETKDKYGFDLSGDKPVAGAGTETASIDVEGIEIDVFKTKDNIISKIFTNDEGISTVLIEEEDGEFTFLQKVGNGMQKISKAIAFGSTSLSFETLKNSIVNFGKLFDNEGKGNKGLLGR